MRRTIDLKTKPTLVSRYKSLLREEWDGLLDSALRLLDDQLRLSGLAVVWPWQANGKVGATGHVLRIPDGLSDELIPWLRRLHSPEWPSIPEVKLDEQAYANTSHYRTAIRVAVGLTLQAQFEFCGEDGLFRDTQSLVYLGTVYELLPKLKSAHDSDLHDMHDLLVNVLAYHCTFIWRNDTAHQQFLLGILAGYTNNEELEGKSLLASFHLIDPCAHDYLTKAQACLFHFLEHRRYDTAKSFLLGVCRQAPQESLAELREMLDDTYAEANCGK